MITAATTVQDYEKPRGDKPGYDDDCREMSEEMDAAYKEKLQPVARRAMTERYNEKRR